MEINVAQLMKEYIGATRSHDVHKAVVLEDSNNHEVTGTVKLTRTDRGILVKGTLHTEADVACSRCLEPYSCPLTLDIEEEYFPTVEVVSGLPLDRPDEPDSFTIDAHHILDLTGAVQQYALLALPMKPLCSEACAGLCPTCGQNLNEESCRCQPQGDPRWSELRKLLSRTR
ncbi:MAG: DUF177 domain-containing protein [Chloroflexi bacterium]|nr:DUF177 domain-containing protein [Chloroflexota bacterium]